jgi:alcohol dehydrogenase, propanol-preferring
VPEPVPETMSALRLHEAAAPGHPADLRWEQVPTPRPAATQVLVRVDACGLGDDLPLISGEETPPVRPVTLGREASGVIAATGPQVADWQPGDRVAIVGGIVCERCVYCTSGRDNLCIAHRALGRDRDGAHAEFVLVDEHALLAAPGELGAELVALVTRTVAVPYHALKRAGAGEGVTLSVHGLDGRGLHAIQLARLTGAHVIGVDRGERLERALDWGADEVVDTDEGDVAHRVRELTEGGVDRSLELTGQAESVPAAVDCLRPGGRATLQRAGAWTLPQDTLARVVDQELDLVGSPDPTLQDVGELLDLLADGRLDLTRSVGMRVHTSELPARLPELVEHDPVSIVAAPGAAEAGT